MPTKIQAVREKQILDFLASGEAGTKEIEEELGIPYATARRLLIKLEKDERVEISRYDHGKGGARYRLLYKDPMPRLKAFNETYPALIYLDEMAQRAQANGGKFYSDGLNEATHSVALALAMILREAYRSVDEKTIDDGELSKARQALVKSERAFAEMGKLCRQIIETDSFWEQTFLAGITQSEVWNTAQVMRAYDVLTGADERVRL
jgi:predicted ArsR family transcriptional regulator